MDDPLSLLAFAVWTLAAGMYPLGFMFGICSACCNGCQPCNNCIHRFKGGPAEPQFGCGAPLDITFTTAAGSVTFPNYTIDNVAIRTVLNFACSNKEVRIIMRQISKIFPAPVDECGCFGCGYNLVMFLSVQGTETSIAFPRNLFLGSCEQTTDTVTKDFQIDLNSLDAGICGVTSSTITATIQTEPCECGACCYGDGACEENATEFYCEDPVGFLGNPQGVWQGVGTDCDPNPCPQPE